MEFKKKIYEQFADNLNKHKIPWIVLHGIEGYPDSIGRDLDITCKNKKDEKIIERVFVKSLLENKDIEWIIKPSPIWGKRILGINKKFNVAELHVIRPVRTGIVEFRPCWDSIDYIEGCFPVNTFMTYAKSNVMPLISGDIKGLKDIKNDDVPLWMKKVNLKIINRIKVTRYDILFMMVQYTLFNPLNSLKNFLLWIKIKYSSHRYPTTPIIKLCPDVDSKRFEKFIREELSNVFLDIKFGDKLTRKQIGNYQAKQQLVYIKESPLPFDVLLTKQIINENKFMLPNLLINKFAWYNRKWKC